MAAITQRISNYLGGVSRQSDDKILPGQVRECLNGYPDPTFGLLKRPGLELINKELGTGTTYSSSQWFFIARDGDEKYIGCIKPAAEAGAGGDTDGGIHIWNATTGVKCTVIYDGKAWAASTAYSVNDQVKNDTDKIYKCIKAGTSAGSGGPTGTADSIDDNGIEWKYLKTNPDAKSYLSSTNRNHYKTLTVHDTTIICNNQVKVEAKAAPTPAFIPKAQAAIVLSDVASGNYKIEFKKTDANGTLSSYLTAFEDDAASDETYQTLKTKFRNAILDTAGTSSDFPLSGLTDTGNSVVNATNQAIIHLKMTHESDNDGSFRIRVRGGAANNKLRSFQDQVNTVADLPSQSMQDWTVEVVNTDSDADSYFTKFQADDGIQGMGYWEETISPAVSTGLKDETMPHELVNIGTNEFVFREISYVARAVGDDTTNAHPSFVNHTIQQAFFYSNRLGFLSEDNVSMSQAGDFYNFYHISARTLTDADPVDINCSSTKPATLTTVIPTTQGLVLFSKYQQFILFAENGILTPTNTIIRTMSSYEMDTDISPIDRGTSVNFVSKTPSYTRVFALSTRGQEQNPLVIDVSRVVSEWMPTSLDTLISSAQNQFIALFGQDSEYLYFFRTYNDGEKNLIEAWFNWKLPGKIQAIGIDSDDMYVVTLNDASTDQFSLSKVSLSHSPDDAIIVNKDGDEMNPCMDLWTAASNSTGTHKVVYDGTESKCYIPYNDITTLNPAIIIKGNDETDSGFTVSPERGSDSNGTYFKVPSKNLSGIDKITIANGGSGYTSATVEFVGGGGSGATATATLSSGVVTDITITDVGSNYTSAPTVHLRTNKGAWTASTAYVTNDQVTNNDRIYTLTSGNHTSGSSGAPTHTSGTQTTGGGDWQYAGTTANVTATVLTDRVIVGYKYDFDVTLPKVYYTLDQNGRLTDFTASLSVSRMKFSVGLSGNVNFKLKQKGRLPGTKSYTGDGSTTVYNWDDSDINNVDRSQIKVKINNAVTTAFTWTDSTTKTSITFNSAPSTGDEILIYMDEWYMQNPIINANVYLADDVPLKNQSTVTLPIHQRSDNFDVRLFNDSPFPVSLNAMMWEGHYSPRFYRRLN